MAGTGLTPRLLTPSAALIALVEGLGVADLDAATSCFCRQGRLITADRTTVAGRRDIAAVLVQLIDRGTAVELAQATQISTGEVALLSADCTMRATAPEGATFTHRSQLTAVCHLIEADWKLAILDPWGCRRDLGGGPVGGPTKSADISIQNPQ